MSEQSFLCFVVNLERSVLRLKSIQSQLNDAGIAFERFPAVDGQLLGDVSSTLLDRDGYRRKHGKEASLGEVGCYLSHVNLMNKFLSTEYDYCLVLEDDAVIAADLKYLVEEVVRTPAKWDLVMLYGNHSAQPVVTAKLSRGRDLVGYFGKQTSTVAYLINRRAAKAYAGKLLPMSLPIDHAMGKIWNFGLRIRGVSPLPVSYLEFGTDIHVNPKFKWSQRLGTYGHRLTADLCRLGYQLVCDPIWLEALLRRWRGR